MPYDVGVAVAAKTVVESLREVVQDLLVPEFKALKVSVDALRGDMQDMRAGLKESADSLRTEMKLRDDDKIRPCATWQSGSTSLSTSVNVSRPSKPDCRANSCSGR